MNEPSFPPLFHGHVVTGQIDPFEQAKADAIKGCDAGRVLYKLEPDTLQAAIVFAPEVPLEDAMAMLPLCGVGFQNALGALAPPEVAVHLGWDGHIRVNGASCGKLDVEAPDGNTKDVPDWLVVGLTLRLWPESDETGHTPDRTALYAEGCADVSATALLESWVKHTLVGINTWTDLGVSTLHKEWSGLAHGLGDQVELAEHRGLFIGVDERFGMLIKTKEKTHLVPLTHLLDHR